MGRNRDPDVEHQGRALSDADLDRLFSVPPAEFVGERKRLAQALKGAGRREEAKALEKLPRPTAVVWAVNQLARREGDKLRRFLRLTDELREIHERMLAGQDAGGDYGTAAKEHREVLNALRGGAEALLAELGKVSSPQLLQGVVSMLRAGAAADPETRRRLSDGRLEREVGQSGFEGLLEPAVAAGAAAPGVSARPPQRPPARARERESRDLADSRRRQEAERRQREAAAREAERERARARAAAERRVDALRGAVSAARRTLDKEERARAAAREALAKAEARLEHARREAELRSRELLAAEEELDRKRR